MDVAILKETKQSKARNDVSEIPLSRITPVQTRAELRQAAVEEYADRIRNGEPMDPAVVFLDFKSSNIWLACGHHRAAAYHLAGRTTMPCIRRSGTKWDAAKAGLADNQRHVGVRLSNADKVWATKVVLRMQPDLSDSAIGGLCGTHRDTVGKYRAELEALGEIRRLDARTGADGRTRKLPGAKPKPEPAWGPVEDLPAPPQPPVVEISAEAAVTDTMFQLGSVPEVQAEVTPNETQDSCEHAASAQIATSPPGEPQDAIRPGRRSVDTSWSGTLERASREPAADGSSEAAAPPSTDTLSVDGDADQPTPPKVPTTSSQRGSVDQRACNLSLIDAALAAVVQLSARVDALSGVPNAEGSGAYTTLLRNAREAKSVLEKWRSEFAM